jgi:dihydropteroate synthase
VSFVRRARFDWQLRTRCLALGERTRVMAVINLTPDSFSGDGLAERGISAGIAAAVAAFDAGADILDLGAESTRPGAEPIRSYIEQSRLLPVLEGVLAARPRAILSVDTYHAATALAAARAGVEIVNDVSGLTWDTAMAEAVVDTRCGLVLMHTRGRSWDWRAQPRLALADVVPTVMAGLREQLGFAQAAGVGLGNIVLDPGFGFGKLGRENFALLAGFDRLAEFQAPLLAGVSRKGFLGDAVKPLQREPMSLEQARRTASVAANTAAILAGAHILRVHDVQAAREAAAIADAIASV